MQAHRCPGLSFSLWELGQLPVLSIGTPAAAHFSNAEVAQRFVTKRSHLEVYGYIILG